MTTSALAAQYDPIQEGFEDAVRNFKQQIQNTKVFQQISATENVHTFYKAMDEWQKDRNSKGLYQNLRKIAPFLENLRGYAEVIEAFLKIKPDVLALIWGPIKLVLQWASALKTSLDAITNTMRDIGSCLSEFRRMTGLFQDTMPIKDALLLFFEDLLKFYAAVIKFFSSSRWKTFFEALWPRQREIIKDITQDIERRVRLLRTEFHIEQSQVEHTARLRAYEHYDKVEKMNKREVFWAIKNEISPKGYQAKFDWCKGRVCQGTEQWLLAVPVFQKWIDISDTSTPYLWLHGIPGAGKTFLSSLVVEQVRKLSPASILYAFLSYNLDGNASALSIIHSLIFQMVGDDDELQEIICHYGWERLKQDFRVAERLLCDLINCEGPVYIVIDGVDEIGQTERRRLLDTLEVISKACKSTKILVSSRVENDITNVLRNKSSIRIDQFNSSAIHQYASQRTTDWLAEAGFTADAEVEIRKLLEPLATTSEGMFLYLKIVFDSIQMFENIDDIRSELRALPESLNAAYGRILERINHLQTPRLKANVRKLLGWIGCAITPMTIQELEQALVIKDDSTADTIKVDASLNAVKLCGPIVEVVDDSVQFVHFTVKEYLFSTKIPGNIDGREATLDLAITCLTYLLTDLYTLHGPTDLIDHRIRNGSYRLHNFVTATWFDHIRNYLSFYLHDDENAVPPKLINLLKDFTKLRHNDEILDQNPKSSPAWLNALKSLSPSTYDFLSMVAEFQKTRSNLDFDIKKGAAEWVDLDPTCISKISVRVYDQLDRLLERGSTLPAGRPFIELQRHYGSRPFKCPVSSCPFSRTGFAASSLRDTHLTDHKLPWKCDIPGCELARYQFPTEEKRDEHIKSNHVTERVEVVAKQLEEEDLEEEEQYHFLLDLVRFNEVDSIQKFEVEFRNLSHWHQKEIVGAAAFSASSTTFDFLLDNAELMTRDLEDLFDNFAELVKCGQTQNCEAITKRCLNAASRGDRYIRLVKYAQLAAKLLQSDSKHLWQLWVSFAQKCDHGERLMESEDAVKKVPFWHTVCRATLDHNDRQDTLIEWLKTLIRDKRMDSSDLVDVMKGATETACSVTIVTFLLDNGVDPCKRTTGNQLSFLHRAARNNTAEAAEIMRLLLDRGADPASKPGRGKIKEVRDEVGAQNIEQWLGITFDKLVDNAQRKRAQEGNS